MDALATFLEVLNLGTCLRLAEAIRYMRGKAPECFPYSSESLDSGHHMENVIQILGLADPPIGSALMKSIDTYEDCWILVYAGLAQTRDAYEKAMEFGGVHNNWFWKNLVPQVEFQFFCNSKNEQLVYNEKCRIYKTYDENGNEEFPYNPPSNKCDIKANYDFQTDDDPF